MNRADKKRNIDKVAASLAKDPLQTEREIAKDVDIGLGTVHRAKKQVEQNGTKDDRIISLTDGDFDIMKRIQEIKKERLENQEKVSNKDVDLRENTASKRYTLFRGKATDESGGLNSISELDLID